MQTKLFDTRIYGNPATCHWHTPEEITTPILRAFGLDQFDLDPCSYTGQHLADRYFTEEDDGLTSDWGGAKTVWINPPSGTPKSKEGLDPYYTILGGRRHRSYSLLFWAKMRRLGCHGAFMAYNVATLQQSPPELSMLDHNVLMLNKRVRYVRPDGTVGKQPMFPSAIVLVGEFDPDPLRAIGKLMVPESFLFKG